MDTVITIIGVLILMFFFFNRGNQNMPPWVRWLGWAIFIGAIIFRVAR